MGVKKQREFDPNTFLATVGEGRKFVLFLKNYGILRKGILLMRCFMSRRAR